MRQLLFLIVVFLSNLINRSRSLYTGEVPYNTIHRCYAGLCDLKDTVTLSGDGDTVVLYGNKFLVDEPIVVDHNLIIIGESILNQNSRPKIHGDNVHIFEIASGFHVKFFNLAFTNGNGFDMMGGAIHVHTNSEVHIEKSYFHNCKSANGGAIKGEKNSIIHISDSEFISNTADVHGGAIYSSGSFLGVNTTSFSDNVATIGAGAIRAVSLNGNEDGSIEMVVRDSIFFNNRSPKGGAIASLNSKLLTMSNINFHNNHASSCGGALYDFDSKITMIGCTFNQNNAQVFTETQAICIERSTENIHTLPLFVMNTNFTGININNGDASIKYVNKVNNVKQIASCDFNNRVAYNGIVEAGCGPYGVCYSNENDETNPKIKGLSLNCACTNIKDSPVDWYSNIMGCEAPTMAPTMQVCSTDGGYVSKEECIFPFIVDGIVFHECAYAPKIVPFISGSLPKEPKKSGNVDFWCPTVENYNQDEIGVRKKWGYCDSACGYTSVPTVSPIQLPTTPTQEPSVYPTQNHTITLFPSTAPSSVPSERENFTSTMPSRTPSSTPSVSPSHSSLHPTSTPSSNSPSLSPSINIFPSLSPSILPTQAITYDEIFGFINIENQANFNLRRRVLQGLNDTEITMLFLDSLIELLHVPIMDYSVTHERVNVNMIFYHLNIASHNQSDVIVEFVARNQTQLIQHINTQLAVLNETIIVNSVTSSSLALTFPPTDPPSTIQPTNFPTFGNPILNITSAPSLPASPTDSMFYVLPSGAGLIYIVVIFIIGFGSIIVVYGYYKDRRDSLQRGKALVLLSVITKLKQKRSQRLALQALTRLKLHGLYLQYDHAELKDDARRLKRRNDSIDIYSVGQEVNIGSITTEHHVDNKIPVPESKNLTWWNIMLNFHRYWNWFFIFDLVMSRAQRITMLITNLLLYMMVISLYYSQSNIAEYKSSILISVLSIVLMMPVVKLFVYMFYKINKLALYYSEHNVFELIKLWLKSLFGLNVKKQKRILLLEEEYNLKKQECLEVKKRVIHIRRSLRKHKVSLVNSQSSGGDGDESPDPACSEFDCYQKDPPSNESSPVNRHKHMSYSSSSTSKSGDSGEFAPTSVQVKGNVIIDEISNESFQNNALMHKKLERELQLLDKQIDNLKNSGEVSRLNQVLRNIQIYMLFHDGSCDDALSEVYDIYNECRCNSRMIFKYINYASSSTSSDSYMLKSKASDISIQASNDERDLKLRSNVITSLFYTFNCILIMVSILFCMDLSTKRIYSENDEQVDINIISKYWLPTVILALAVDVLFFEPLMILGRRCCDSRLQVIDCDDATEVEANRNETDAKSANISNMYYFIGDADYNFNSYNLEDANQDDTIGRLQMLPPLIPRTLNQPRNDAKSLLHKIMHGTDKSEAEDSSMQMQSGFVTNTSGNFSVSSRNRNCSVSSKIKLNAVPNWDSNNNLEPDAENCVTPSNRRPSSSLFHLTPNRLWDSPQNLAANRNRMLSDVNSREGDFDNLLEDCDSAAKHDDSDVDADEDDLSQCSASSPYAPVPLHLLNEDDRSKIIKNAVNNKSMHITLEDIRVESNF